MNLYGQENDANNNWDGFFHDIDRIQKLIKIDMPDAWVNYDIPILCNTIELIIEMNDDILLADMEIDFAIDSFYDDNIADIIEFVNRAKLALLMPVT